MEPENLKRYWIDQALDCAGIARGRWRPGAGLQENRCVVKAVYDYYGQLFLERPYLQWAGMAAMTGPAFYAGFKDLGFFPDAARRTVAAIFGRKSRQLSRSAGSDLGFYETTFLTMQKKIFEDQACMHQAYITGGMPQLDALFHAGIIDIATLKAWQQIDTGGRNGDWAAMVRGNRALLFREQFDIIDRFYAHMFRFRRVEGRAFTYLMTLTGTPSIPGASSFPERYPLTFGTRLWRTVLSTRTPLADGNIAIFADRWKLIEADTLPSYLALIHDDIGKVEDELQKPIAERTARYALLRNVPKLAVDALTHWRVHIGAGPTRSGVQSSKPGAPAGAGIGDDVVVDLTRPPTRESGGLPADADIRAWMSRDREPVEVAVSLPGDRVYRARAAMAVMLSSADAGNPDRLVVQLPPSDLAAAWDLVARYAGEWGFPDEQATRWHTRAESRTRAGLGSDPDPETYSTQVFTADDAGFVHLEFQVSHHIGEEKEFVLAALFSWDDPVTTLAP